MKILRNLFAPRRVALVAVMAAAAGGYAWAHQQGYVHGFGIRTPQEMALFCGVMLAVMLCLQAWIQWKGRLSFMGASVDLRVLSVIILGTLLPMFHTARDGFRFTGDNTWDQFVYFFVFPMIFIVLVFGERPKDYGFCLGNWREGLLWTAIGCGLMAPILWYLGHHNEAMQHYYSMGPERPVGVVLGKWGVEMMAWEFIWRGFYLAALLRVMPPGPALFLHAVPFCFMHMGKPLLETLSTPFGGACFGFVAWRSRSFVPAFLIHWFMIVFLELCATGRI